MCNRKLASFCQSSLHSDSSENNQQHYQVLPLMDGPSSNSNTAPTSQSTPNSNDETPRVKFLCSFGGAILPRPQDGKLRHVGGETRIVSFPREITYDELMARMRELFEGASVLKYQQPDEDLDALVSVVNDDDVMNMMEEYDKLGSVDGFTRLRIFLFSHPDQDGSSHYIDGNERESEKRYVDALNNMNDPLDFRRHPESPMIREMDDMHLAEHLFGSMSLEGGLHSQRNSEMHMPQMNLNQLTIPRLGSGQYQQPISQRYGEMEGPWSPAYYSPRHYGHHDPRAEFPPSPSSARYGMAVGEFPDKCFDRIPDEGSWPQTNHQPAYENHQQYHDNVVWVPASGPLPGEKAGFPGNIMHGPNVLDGNNFCDHCYIGVPRTQSHLDQHAIGNNVPQINNPRPEGPASRENYILNGNSKLHHGVYTREQTDPRIVYNDSHSQERGWILQHQLNPRPEDARVHINGTARVNEHYAPDASCVNFSVGHGNFNDGHHSSMNYVRQHNGPDFGGEVFHDQSPAIHAHSTLPEEHTARYGNLSYAYGPDHLHPPLGHALPQVLWRPNAVHAVPTYEASYSPQPVNGMISSGLPRTMPEGSPRVRIGGDNPSAWVETSQKVLGNDGINTAEYPTAVKGNSSHCVQDTPNLPIHDAIQPPQIPSAYIKEQVDEIGVAEVAGLKNVMTNGVQVEVNKVNTPTSIIEPDKILKTNLEGAPGETCPANCLTSAEGTNGSNKIGITESSPTEHAVIADENPGFIPEAHNTSTEKAATEVAEHEESKAEENSATAPPDVIAKDANRNDVESNTQGESHVDSENDNANNFKIEPTKAEAEAIARGLQTIRNDDLEEIRELGSGTYGAVYHGKWKGSDVAIKRIKASCFAGKPSERERLIADFWKEALILSSLHHPNVVSFYGIVRDGPDGSLATVTEFMINGSLKQFLQKKDRTIDRRKRLIIAMDAAFGMEYLHGKNIVHFDLKCENLLVNMRDPQRPVCKIGDLGLSKVKQHTLVSGGVRGTLPWMAPELLSGKSNMVTEKIDVYSFGIVLWELLTGDEPYSDMHCAAIIGGIVNNTLRPTIPTWCDPEWKSLMESCWASDPSERPSFSAISQKLRSMAAAMNVK